MANTNRKPEPEICGICLERLTYNRRNIHETICGHKFHACCFREIPEAKCPYCRRDVDHEPNRKLQLLNTELDKIRYDENQGDLQRANMIDYMNCDIRIQYLREELAKEMERKKRIIETIRNTRLYYKYKKQEVKNRMKCVKLDIFLNREKKRILREAKLRSKIDSRIV